MKKGMSYNEFKEKSGEGANTLIGYMAVAKIQGVDFETSCKIKTTLTINTEADFSKMESLVIPKLSIKYPVINETTEEYLKIAPTKLFGPNANEVGNLCIIGHNM